MLPSQEKQNRLTAERVRFLLDYDPAEGVFRWKNKTHKDNRAVIGSVAGCHHKSSGYWTIWIDKYQYSAHRLAWFYMTGEWPKNLIDHIDHDKLNNSFSNLRDATNSENKANGRRYKKKKNLPKGVFIISGSLEGGNKRYGAQIVHKYKHYSLGGYHTPEEAHAAYLEAAKKFHGEFAHDGNVIAFKEKVA